MDKKSLIKKQEELQKTFDELVETENQIREQGEALNQKIKDLTVEKFRLQGENRAIQNLIDSLEDKPKEKAKKK